MHRVVVFTILLFLGAVAEQHGESNFRKNAFDTWSEKSNGRLLSRGLLWGEHVRNMQQLTPPLTGIMQHNGWNPQNCVQPAMSQNSPPA